MRITFNNNDCN